MFIYIASMLFLSLSLTMIIGFGYLGYSDQNRELAVTCLANSTSDVALRLNLTESEMESYGVKNVSRRFTFLFKSGFWILLAYLFLAIIWATCFRNKTRSAAVVKTLLSVLLVRPISSTRASAAAAL